MTDAPSQEADTHQYLVGDLTFKHVFQAAKLVNMSDMQAVLNAVENALVASANPEPMPAKDDSDNVVLSNDERAIVSGDGLGVVRDDAGQHRSVAAAEAIRTAFFTSVSGEKPHRYHLSLAYPTMDAMHEAEDALKAWAKSILEPDAATKRTTPEERDAWMSDPLSLDAGLPPTNQAGDADSLALIQRMANRETDPGGCLDIVSWLIEADRLADPARAPVVSVASPQVKKANAQVRANAVAGAHRFDAAASSAVLKLREVLRTELERQCAMGAGTFTIDDGFAQSGLWQVNADLDSGSLIAALAQAQPQTS